MIESDGEEGEPANVPLHEVYIVELREQALVLIELGYRRMTGENFSAAEEDAITGELVRHMKDAMEESDAPIWTERYSVSEQVRSNASGKQGKRRAIVDIEFEQHKRGLRPRLRFEAKRLYSGSGVAEYVGDEGLSAFLTGHYSRTHTDVGMLGYVQEDTAVNWAEKLSKRLIHPNHRIVPKGGWLPVTIKNGPSHIYYTNHLDQASSPLQVVHVLMRFL
ncbi:MAG: hypothetical protein QM715_16705 [Nibricoccus sp.]